MVQTLRREQYVVEQVLRPHRVGARQDRRIRLRLYSAGHHAARRERPAACPRRTEAAAQAGGNHHHFLARDSLDDKIEGLELGADDDPPKPFHLAELERPDPERRAPPPARWSGESRCRKTCGCFLTAAGWKSRAGRSNRCARSTIYSIHLMPPEPYDRQDDAGRSRVGRPHRPSRQFRFRLRPDENLRRRLHDAQADIEIRAVYGFGYKLVTP